MAINVRGTMLCYKYAAQQMVKQGRGGRIIGASSAAGREGKRFFKVETFVVRRPILTTNMTGLPMLTAYSASKFAIRGLTQAAGKFSSHRIAWYN